MAGERISITVETTIKVPVTRAWELWTSPAHVTHWNFASDDWHSPKAENDLRPGGKFCYRMEARDGSTGFDFRGVYDEIKPNERIAFTLGDGRKVRVDFSVSGPGTKIVEVFEAESQNPPELQRKGWHAILDNFKRYAESLK